MKTRLKATILLILLMNLYNAYSQEIINCKTTELYYIEAGMSFSDIMHYDQFMTWDFDLKKQKIVYKNASDIKTFYFSSIKENQHSNENNLIFHFDNSEESLVLIIKSGNYIKIKVASDKEPNSNPASFRKSKIFTNYTIDNLTNLFNN